MTAGFPSIFIVFPIGSSFPKYFLAISWVTTTEFGLFRAVSTSPLINLNENNLKIKDITDVIATIDPLEGAAETLDWIRERTQIIEAKKAAKKDAKRATAKKTGKKAPAKATKKKAKK